MRISDLEVTPEQETDDLPEEAKFNAELEGKKKEVFEDAFSNFFDDLEEDAEFVANEEDEEYVEISDEDEEEELTEESEEDSEQEEEPEKETSKTSDYSKVKEKLSGIYEDVGEDEDAILSSIDRLIEERAQSEADKEAVEALTDLFDESDVMLSIAREMKDNKLSFEQAFGKVVDFEEFKNEIKESDPQEYDKMLEAQFERKKSKQAEIEAQKTRNREFKANQKQAVENWNSFVKENELSVEEAETLASEIDGVINTVAQGGIAPDLIQAIHVYKNLEALLEKAREEGRNEGLNKNIKKVRRSGKKGGDGLPRLRSGGKQVEQSEEQTGNPFFDLKPQPRKRLADM